MNTFSPNTIEDNEVECDPYIEHLRKKYLHNTMGSEKTSSSTRSSGNIPDELLSITPASSLTESERRHYTQAMTELKNLLRIGESKLETTVAHYESAMKKIGGANHQPSKQNDDIKQTCQDSPPDIETTLIQSTTLPTMPSDFTTSSYKPSKSVRISLEPTTFFESEFSTGLEGTWPGPGILRSSSINKKFEPTDVKVIHEELMNIHQKLNQRSKHLSQLEADVNEREQDLIFREDQLSEREKNLCFFEKKMQRVQDVMMRLQGVESNVQEKFVLLQEYHVAEIEKFQFTLAEKLKECKRLKTSFDVLKTQNEALKLQGNELTGINQKLQTQNFKLKKRLENLQRKQQYGENKKFEFRVLNDQTNKNKPEEKSNISTINKSIDKTSKVWSNSLEALSVSLDWISEIHLKPIDDQEIKLEGQHMSKEFMTDKCLKVLPLLVEVLRYLPICTTKSKHHLPYLRFIYCALQYLEDSHHALLSSTARRIGEELLKPISYRLISDTSADSTATGHSSLPFAGVEMEYKAKSQVFFHSTNVELRMLSSFIVLRTLHQVDMLAQVFEQLRRDLKEEENRKLFLQYSATQTVLPYLTYKTNKTLIGSAVDVMLQMAMESNFLPAFLELCSCETWFRAVSSAIRTIAKSSDTATLEKLVIILQKLSKIKSNKKYFETFSLGRALQELHRECHPDSTFLSLNLRSILFNLNLLKSNSTLGTTSTL